MVEENRFQVQGRTKVINGSILNPHNAGLRFVLSVNNLAGKTSGHVLYPVFDKKWVKVKEEARGWYANKTGAYKLGAVNTTAVQSDVWVIHCLAQNEKLEINYAAMETCLKEVCKMAKSEKASVHVSSLLVGLLPELTALLDETLIKNGVSVFYYNEPT
jgi:hypothetical protein